jgi:hypothetical protein
MFHASIYLVKYEPVSGELVCAITRGTVSSNIFEMTTAHCVHLETAFGATDSFENGYRIASFASFCFSSKCNFFHWFFKIL